MVIRVVGGYYPPAKGLNECNGDLSTTAGHGRTDVPNVRSLEWRIKEVLARSFGADAQATLQEFSRWRGSLVQRTIPALAVLSPQEKNFP